MQGILLLGDSAPAPICQEQPKIGAYLKALPVNCNVMRVKRAPFIREREIFGALFEIEVFHSPTQCIILDA